MTASGWGFVSLVGAGPGDPELITVKGLRRLREATVVVYDRLVPEALLAEARGAETIAVGKQPGRPGLDQEAINRLLIDRARRGQRVVRLKGGDPFVLGRGGEEAEALAAAGVPFEVVPGVSAAIAVPAYAGIPVTHRDHASSFLVLAGSRARAGAATGGERPTAVLLMGMAHLRENLARLVDAGYDPETPAAAIHLGTTPAQRVVEGELAGLADRVAAEGLTAPAVVVVGGVVRLRRRLRWFDPAGAAGTVPGAAGWAAAPGSGGVTARRPAPRAEI